MKVNQFNKIIFSAIILLWLTACASNNSLDVAALQQADINNFRTPSSAVLSSGQPTLSQLGIASRAGVKHVINLRTPQEDVEFDEAAVVESLGMDYHSIPVAGGAGVNAENAASLQQLLDRYRGEPILIHCATGNRVGALMALSAFANGEDVEDAVSEGARWGMTSERLQELVRNNLGNN